MKILFNFLLSVFLLISSSLVAQIKSGDPLPTDPAVKMGKLKNGLTYYIRKNSIPEKKVELRLVVNAGSILEDDDQQGLAHMSEHMAFNGTKNFKKNEIVSFLQDIGVGFGNDLNAYTSFDETVYILPIPTDKPGNLEKGFQILEDWAHNVTYLDEDIEGERAIILEESRLGKGANDRMFRQIYPKLFEGSKYAKRLPIGIDSIIKTFPYNKIRNYYHDWYRPDLMAVIVVGDVDPVKAEEMITSHFASLVNPSNEKKREEASVLKYASSNAMVVTDKEATGYRVSINYPYQKISPASTMDDYRKDLIQQLYTTMLNQRLQELAQNENPPFLNARTDFDSYARGYKGFNATAGVGTGDVQKGLDALATEIERVKRYGYTASELERAKKNQITQYELAYNNRDKMESGDLVDEYINNFTAGEPFPGIENEFRYVKELLPGITIDEVNAVTGQFESEKNIFVYATGPEPVGGKKLPDAEKLLSIISSKEKEDIAKYEEKVLPSSLLSFTPKAGKVIAKSKNTVLGTTELTLSNGVKVTLKPTTFKNDEIMLAATRPGGKNFYGLKDKYNAEYAIQVVSSMGIGEFSPSDLKKVLAGKSVAHALTMTNISEGVSGHSSNNDLETLLQLNYLDFTSPRKDTALFKSYIQRNKSQYAMLMSNPQAAFIDTLYKTLYNNNPLAPVFVPNSSNYDKINMDRAVEIYNERFGDASGMNFVLVGSFKESEVIPLIEKYLGSLPSSKKIPSYVDNRVRPITGKKELLFHKGKEQKSAIIAFYTGAIPYSEDLDLKIQAMSEVLNIRIIEELREKIQGIYGGGTFASLNKLPYGNYEFILQLPCGPEKVDTLIKAVKKEFESIVQNGPEKSYLEKVKKQWIEQYRTSIKENNTWLNQLIDLKLNGGNPDRFVNYEKYVNALTPKDIQSAARLVLGGKNEFFAVQMPGE